MNKFEKLGVNPSMLKALEEQNITDPTEIQEKTIPLVLEGKDIIAGSATGSGKTLAFAAGILAKSEKGKGIQALVLTPTRELAIQVKDAIKSFSKYDQRTFAIIHGGVAIGPQIDNLKRSEIVVGTPGRILDHMERGTIDLRNTKTLVLDEADRMLDMGFIDDVRRIISQCPKERQTLLFSATIYQEIVDIANHDMNNPIKITAKSFVDPSKLEQIYFDVDKGLKISLLVHLLKNEESGLVMVFCNTRMNVDFVVKNLKAQRIEAQAIHGGFSQAKRTKTITQFHSKHSHVLVCTDVAARGLDIPLVSHVYNYDIPKDSKEYVHRIGRTARAGKEGIVINLLTEYDYDNFSRVLQDNKFEIRKEKPPYVEKIVVKRIERSGRRPQRGGFRGRGRR
jgi:superfamily II DNA/RNA helicase